MSFTRLSKGSLVLVTGATGLVGSAIVELLIQKGFRVRGAGRSPARAALFKEKLESNYGKGTFEFAEVADLTVESAFEVALRDVSGVIHVASDTNFENLIKTDTDVTLKASADAVLGLMKAAARTASVKSFVLTSSCVSVFVSEYGQDVIASLADFSEHFIPKARATPVDSPARGTAVYHAAKVHGELEAWRFWNDAKPSYAFNTVLPFFIMGPVSNPAPGAYSTHSWTNDIFLGNSTFAAEAFMNPAEFVVDTRDSAAIHIAALLSDDTNGERLWAAGSRYTANDLLNIWREAFPDRKILPDFNFPQAPSITIDKSKSTQLLKEFEGRDWYPLKETVLANVADVL